MHTYIDAIVMHFDNMEGFYRRRRKGVMVVWNGCIFEGEGDVRSWSCAKTFVREKKNVHRTPKPVME